MEQKEKKLLFCLGNVKNSLRKRTERDMKGEKREPI
jgi:hypothetical protein